MPPKKRLRKMIGTQQPIRPRTGASRAASFPRMISALDRSVTRRWTNHHRAKCPDCTPGRRGPVAGALLDAQQLDLENEIGVGRNDVAGAAGAVTELRRDGQLALTPDLHAGHALVPALDDPARA